MSAQSDCQKPFMCKQILPTFGLQWPCCLCCSLSLRQSCISSRALNSSSLCRSRQLVAPEEWEAGLLGFWHDGQHRSLDQKVPPFNLTTTLPSDIHEHSPAHSAANPFAEGLPDFCIQGEQADRCAVSELSNLLSFIGS